MADKTYRYENTNLAKLLRKKFEDPSFNKTQREVALELEYNSSNIISMYKRGEASLPLDKAFKLAASINEDPKYIFRLALEQQINSELTEDVLGKVVTDNEYELVKSWREYNRDLDIKPTVRIKKALQSAVEGR